MNAMLWPFSVPIAPIDVVGVGHNTVDHVCVIDALPSADVSRRMRAYDREPGGAVAVALASLARWGARTQYVGAFGDDDAARMAREALERAGVDCAAARQRVGVPNQVAVVMVDARTGERRVLWHRDAALVLQPDEVPTGDIAAARAVLVDGLDGEAAIAAATAARAARVPVVADIDTQSAALDRLLPLVDVLLVSWPFAREVTRAESPEAALAHLARRGNPVVGITLGADGALVAVGEQCFAAPGFPVAVVDTTGAGAVFRAAFLWGMLDGRPLADTVRLANAAAALHCTRPCDGRSVPSLQQARALAQV